MVRLLVFVMIVAVAALFLTVRPGGESSGPFTTVTIHDLRTNSDRWEGELVRVSGTVGYRAAVLGFGGFMLADDTGREIVVIGHGNPVKPGQSMMVHGRFVTAFALGETSMSAILVSGGN